MYASILQYARSLRVSRLAGAGIAASLAVVLGAAGCDQSTPLCRTGTGTYTIKYTLVSGTGACADLKADIIYVNSYNDVGDEGKPNLEKVSSALMPKKFAELLDRAEFPDQLAAWGAFTESEPSGNVCNIPTFKTQTSKAFPALEAIPDDNDSPFGDGDTDGGREATPEQTITYNWSNWQVYFTPAHAGNAFSVELDYIVQRGTTTDTCHYTGDGLLFGQRPSCSKGTKGNDDEGHPIKPGEYVTEEARCDSVAHPELGLGTGSGVDPEARFTCDAETRLCVSTAKFAGF